PPGLIPAGQLGAVVVPLRFLVGRPVGDRAQPAYQRAVAGGERAGEGAARGLVHERHELVREPGHGAGDADPADVGAAADAVHPTALGHVAVDHRAPAPDLHLALGGVVVVGEVALLVVAGPVATLVHG